MYLKAWVWPRCDYCSHTLWGQVPSGHMDPLTQCSLGSFTKQAALHASTGPFVIVMLDVKGSLAKGERYG